MKRVSYVFFIIIMLISSISYAGDIVVKKGDTAKVPNFNWVDVLNQEVILSGNTEFTYGESCSIKRDGTLTVIGEIDQIDVLVRYTTPNDEESFGAPCPSGIIFQLSKERFSQMTAEYLAKNKAEQEHQQKIAKIIEEAEG